MRNFAQDFPWESKFYAKSGKKPRTDKGGICVHRGHSTLQKSV